MESNHRFLDVNQASLPLDHGTVLFQWTHRELHPALFSSKGAACDTGVLLLDDEPVFLRRKPWDSNPATEYG